MCDCEGCVVSGRPLFSLQHCFGFGQIRIPGELEQRNTVFVSVFLHSAATQYFPESVGFHIYSITLHAVHSHCEEITNARWTIFKGQRAYTTQYSTSLRILTHANFPGSVFSFLDYVT